MDFDLKPLNEQTVVITGASSGIGLATARRAASEGAAVVMVARNEKALTRLARGIEDVGGRAAICAVDIADDDYPIRVGDVADQAFGGFDSWVNNASTSLFADLADVGMEEHRRVLDVGYFGTVRGSLYAARKLRERGGGAIINLGSILGERSVLLQGPYCAMKHAVIGFTDSLRMELERDDTGISVTTIRPNGMDTPYPEHARNKLDKPARLPPGQYDPELVAKAICFACANPKRDLLIGGTGYALTLFDQIAPGVIDTFMKTFAGRPAQTDDIPPEPDAADNLFEPKKDGRVRSNKDRSIRDTSLALEAQMRPARTALLGLGAIAGLAAVFQAARR